MEKKSKYIILLKASCKSQGVKDTILNWLNEIDTKPITYDWGKEFSKWKEIEQERKISFETYFSNSGVPRQWGLNEDSNGMVWRDLLKSTDLSTYSQKKLNEIAIESIRHIERSMIVIIAISL